MNSPHRVIHLSFSSLGGAGEVARRLRDTQVAQGMDASLRSLVDRPFPKWAHLHPGVAGSALLDYYGVRKNPDVSFFTLFRCQHFPEALHGIGPLDLLHVHFMPGYLWPPSFLASLPASQKLVWSLHDLWPLTGGCHYPYGCEEFTRGCEKCPQVNALFHKAVARQFEKKFPKEPPKVKPVLVAPSEWLKQQASRSPWMSQFPCEVIPNPVDTEVFQPGDPHALRKKWGIDPDVFVVGLGAALFRDERKQIKETVEALVDWAEEKAKDRKIILWVFGKGRPYPEFPEWVRFVGRSPSAEVLAEWYTVMDLHVSMSRFETFGNTLAEAAACGTPSVCRAGSGMSDVIDPGATGLEVQTIRDCVEAVEELYQQPERVREMGKAAISRARGRFNDRVVAQRFLDLYDFGLDRSNLNP